MTKRNRPKRARTTEPGPKAPTPSAPPPAEAAGSPPTTAASTPPTPRPAERRVSKARPPGGPGRAGRTANVRPPAASRAKRPDPEPSAGVEPGAARKPESVEARKPESVEARKPESVETRKPESQAPKSANGRIDLAPVRMEAAALHDPARAINGTPAENGSHGSAPRPSQQSQGQTDSAPAANELAPDDDIWSEGLATTELAAERHVLAAEEAPSERPSSEPATRLTRGSGGDRMREAAAFGSAQSLLSTDYYFRQYGAHGMRSLAAEIDDFGFDPHVDDKVRPLLEAFCKRYFRVELVGAEQVPARGRALLVANRAGALPWDGLVLRTALRASRPALSPLRWLAEDTVIHYPFMGVLMNRLGAVRACPENAERLLAQDRLVAVFPEGAQGSRKLFRDRYRLQRFGRGGYVKLALKLGVPLMPTAIIGAEETNPVLGRSRLLGRLVGSEFVPLTPTFPWLGLAGLLPAPVRWRIVIGEPIDLSSYGPEAADDALVIHRLNEQIRSSLQALVDQGKAARGGALFG